MAAPVILFLLANALALLMLPRRWATLPLLMGACYMTGAQGFDLGGFYFSELRILIGVGVIRVLLRGERPSGGLNALDSLMVAWAAWAVCSSVFHAAPKDAVVFRLGMVYNTCGIYFLIRCFCRSIEDVTGLLKLTALVLVPVALEMFNELLTGRNVFAVFGGVAETVAIRNGKMRAQGPFSHSILAGTVGAVCAPMMIGLWHRHRPVAVIGMVACTTMVLASNSSGPLMSLVFGVFALILWHWRHLTRQMRIAAVAGYFLLDLMMKAPAYYLIARIDLTGSSTGYHRARLIEVAFENFDEWWFAGTDYTRHWMPYGVSWSPDHVDITNQYLHMGVIGGFPLMALYIGFLWIAFRLVGRALTHENAVPSEDHFLVWALGASLFAHAATGISVRYFDQSFIFLYLNLAFIASLMAKEVGSSFATSAAGFSGSEPEVVISSGAKYSC